MSGVWIMWSEAVARIRLQTGIADAETMLSDAVTVGIVATDSEISEEDKTRDDLNVFPGGFTTVDMEHDENLAARVNLDDLNAWIGGLAFNRPGEPASKRPPHRPNKGNLAWVIYRELYPNGHKLVCDWAGVHHEVNKLMQDRHGEDVSLRLLKDVVSKNAGR